MLSRTHYRDNRIAISAMFSAAVLWGTFPIAVAIATKFSSYAFVVALSQISSAIFFLISSLISSKDPIHKLFRKDYVFYSFLSGIFAGTGNILVFYAISTDAKIESVIILEMWPLFSIMLAPLVIRTAWERVSPNAWACVLAAFAGTILLAGDPRTIDFELGFHIPAALFGAFLYGLSAVILAEGSRRFRKHFPHYSPRQAVFFVRAVETFHSSVLTSCFMFYTQTFFTGSVPAVLAAVWIGVIAFGVQGMLSTVAWQYATTPVVGAINFFAPFFGIFFLAIFALDTLNSFAIIGGVVILISNIIIVNRYRYQTSIIWASASFVFFGVLIIFLDPPYPLDRAFSIINMTVILFSIIAGFSLNRAAEKGRQLLRTVNALGVAVVELINFIYFDKEIVKNKRSARRAADKFLRSVVDFDYINTGPELEAGVKVLYGNVSAFSKQIENIIVWHNALPEVRTSVRSRLKAIDSLVDEIVIQKEAGVSSTEMFALFMWAVMSGSAVLMTRPETLLGDLTALMLCTGFVLILGLVRDYEFDTADRGFVRFMALQRAFPRLGSKYYIPGNAIHFRRIPFPNEPVAMRYFDRRTNQWSRLYLRPQDRVIASAMPIALVSAGFAIVMVIVSRYVF